MNLVFAANLSGMAAVRSIIVNDLGCRTDKLAGEDARQRRGRINALVRSIADQTD